MIKSVVRVDPTLTGREEVIVVPLFEGDKVLKGPVRKLDVLCRSAISGGRKNGRFPAKRGDTVLLATPMTRAPQYVLMLGLGKRSELSAERAADAGGAASRALRARGFKTAHLLLPEHILEDERTDTLAALLKGFLLAQYDFAIKEGRHAPSSLRRLAVMAPADRRLSRIVRRVRVVVDHTARVRDLVNKPANFMTPSDLANEARTICEDHGIHCRILGRRELERKAMGAVLAVGRGSEHEPRFVVMHYNKGHKGPRVCLVGKAVTFDSGGISIKPWMKMNEMKGDMAGGAVVLETIAAAARLRLPVEIIGLVPCVENMPDGAALRPGDVITTYAGKTIEILSTDAEGRLILSDALTYAQEFRPDLTVDFATLTGAVVIALGTRIAAVMGNDSDSIGKLIAAGTAAGELVWQLPLDDVFRREVRGDISDYKNYSGRDGSSITAAALLAEFAGARPWMHVDIAGTYWSEGGKVSYQGKGATGYGVDLTLRLLESLA